MKKVELYLMKIGTEILASTNFNSKDWARAHIFKNHIELSWTEVYHIQHDVRGCSLIKFEDIKETKTSISYFIAMVKLYHDGFLGYFINEKDAVKSAKERYELSLVEL